MGVCCPPQEVAIRPTQRPSKPVTTCGDHDKIMNRIIGGRPTAPGEWPWVVAIMEDNFQFCGGSLITDQHVLTAAHCLKNKTT